MGLSKTRLCERLGEFQPASERQLEAAREAPHRYSPMPARAPQSLWKEYEQTLQEARARRERDWARYRDTAATERQRLKSKYRQQRHLLAALPVSGPDRRRLFQQLELRQTIKPSPQAEARHPARGDSEDTASRHLAPFRRRQRAIGARCARHSTAPSIRTQPGPLRPGKGAISDASRHKELVPAKLRRSS